MHTRSEGPVLPAPVSPQPLMVSAMSLPNDLLHMICTELWLQRDFNTLYSLSLSCKQLAVPALSSIYRMFESAPVTNSGSDEIDVRTRTLKSEQSIVSKWAKLWKSIILSSLGRTVYPYCRYVRTLDFRDLKELLDDPKFRGEYSDTFFANGLSRFKIEIETPAHPKTKKKRPNRLNTLATLEAIGESVTKLTPMVEDLSGEISQDALRRWIERLPRLQQVTLWNGASLAGLGNIMHIHCPSFRTLSFYEWSAADADNHFASFLNGIRPQLQSLEIFSYSDIGAETFLALGCHMDTLTELKLSNLKPHAIQSLSFLGSLTSLTTLHLSEIRPSTDLEKTHSGVFTEIIAWLRKCKDLKDINFSKILSAPAILIPILYENDIHLTNLIVTDYLPSQAQDFHLALAHQPSLETIRLKGEGEDLDIDLLVQSLGQLTKLKVLSLSGVSDFFQNRHICQLARQLKKLEELWISGWTITDGIWSDMAKLPALRRLDINAFSSFTFYGLMGFISALKAGNTGLNLAIMMADPGTSLTEEDQMVIAANLMSKVEGRFEYTLARDPEAIEFSDSDSD